MRRPRRREREGQKPLAELARRGIAATRIHRVICVTLTELEMPAWALARAVAGLPVPKGSVWLRRKDAGFLARCDREAGGEGLMAATEFRRCTVCHRPLLGVEAAARRKVEESSMTGRQLPCGSSCGEASQDRRHYANQGRGVCK